MTRTTTQGDHMTYRIERITFEDDKQIRTVLATVESLDAAHEYASHDYGMDVGAGVWHGEEYIIHCGPWYRDSWNEGEHVNYVIQHQEVLGRLEEQR